MRPLWICTPDTGMVVPQYASSLFHLGMALGTRFSLDTEATVMSVSYHSPPVNPDIARNRLARQALAHPSKPDVLWIDSDHKFSPQAVFGLLDCPYLVVGCPYPQREFFEEGIRFSVQRGDPWDTYAGRYPVRFENEKWELDEWHCTPVTRVGFGLMLTRYEALSLMAEDKTTETLCDTDLMATPTQNLFGRLRVREIGMPHRQLVSEDGSFCERWMQLSVGNKVQCYLGKGSPIEHVGRYTYRGYLEAIQAQHALQFSKTEPPTKK